ncbi:MAG: exonuclease subunit SbcD [Treponema sp.]|jgi:exonuclease SbcD|nr:exonuclease subunit SbcD [Treponema sp.]
MIKFLHTADLHLGKVFHEQSLIEDQDHMLTGLIEILKDQSYAALLIAGDVYDRSVPSPEAVELFGSFLVKLKRLRPGIEILVIPGNHDSPVRLGFGRELFAGLGIHLAASAADAVKPVVIGNGGESCAFFLLPFSGHARLTAETAARLEEARSLCAASGIWHSVVAAHLFAAGGSETGSERVFLGDAERIDMGIFAGFDYAALGHLHRFQRAGKNGWYSGSPLAYSFGEAGNEKYVLAVTPGGGTAESGEGKAALVEPLPVRPLRRLVRIRGPFKRFLSPSPDDAELLDARNDYLEITLDERRFAENALALLRKNFPFLLSINQEEAFAALEKTLRVPGAVSARKDLAGGFEDFLRFLYGSADGAKAALFRELEREKEGENP